VQDLPQAWLRVDLSALFGEFIGFLLHSPLECFGLGYPLLFRIFAHVLGYAHGTEMRAAHAAEMSDFGAFLGKGIVVEFAGGNGVEAKVELVLPAEFKAGLTEGIIAVAR